jgi:hypothetical protein
MIKNCFDGLAVTNCSLRSLAAKKSSLTTSEGTKLPNESRLIFETAITIAARVTDNKITILYNLVRLTTQIGCRIDRRLTRLSVFSSLDTRRTSSVIRTGSGDIPRGNRTGSIEELAPKFVAAG